MAFPVVAARITGRTNNTNTTSHAITMPTGIVAGNLLLVVFSTDGNPTVTAATGGWTKLNQASSTTVATGAIFYKVAAGGDALTLTTTVAEASSHVSLRITNGGTPTATSANNTTANTDPPAHTPAAGSRDYLWIATRSADSTNVATAAPASYANLQTQAAQGTNGASTNTAERSLAAATENPGTFTSTAIGWVAWTISVPPTNATAIPVLVASTATVALPSVVTAQTAVPVLVAATSAVATPAKPSMSVTAALVASTASVATPTAAPKITLVPVLVASTATVALPVVIGTQVLAMNPLASAATVATPAVATHYPVAVASTSTVATPAVATRYPVTIASTAAVAAPTLTATIQLQPAVVVNQAVPLVPSSGLVPSSTLPPSKGGDRVYPVVATGFLDQSVLPERAGPETVIPGPSLAWDIVISPATIPSTASVPQLPYDPLLQMLRPRTIGRTLSASISLAPSAGLVPTVQRDQIYLPLAWVGELQALTPVTVGSISVVGTPTTSSTAYPITANTPTQVHRPTAHVRIYPATLPGLPSSGVTLYPSPSLYPSSSLYPFKAQVPHPAISVASRVVPETIASTATVATPTPSGSGVNVVPLLLPVLVSSASTVTEPTVWNENLIVELEFLDTSEDFVPPIVVLPGEGLIRAEYIDPAATVHAVSVDVGSPTIRPISIAATSTVMFLPATVTLAPQLISTVSSVSRPQIMGSAVSELIEAGVPIVLIQFRAGVPVLD